MVQASSRSASLCPEIIGRDLGEAKVLIGLAKLRKAMLQRHQWPSRECYRWADELRWLARDLEALAENSED